MRDAGDPRCQAMEPSSTASRCWPPRPPRGLGVRATFRMGRARTPFDNESALGQMRDRPALSVHAHPPTVSSAARMPPTWASPAGSSVEADVRRRALRLGGAGPAGRGQYCELSARGPRAGRLAIVSERHPSTSATSPQWRRCAMRWTTEPRYRGGAWQTASSPLSRSGSRVRVRGWLLPATPVTTGSSRPAPRRLMVDWPRDGGPP